MASFVCQFACPRRGPLPREPACRPKSNIEIETFVCQVCFEDRRERLALPRLSTGNGDVLRAGDCNHPICIECTAAFVTARVEEQFVFHIRCPHEGCRNELFEQDVSNLTLRRRGAEAPPLPAAVFERFCELRKRDYAARASGLSGEVHSDDFDYGTLRCMYESTRLCPRCSLVIEKSEGCNSFYCICGHHFHYASAPRLVGNGVKRFCAVIDLAEKHRLPLSAVEKAVQRLGGRPTLCDRAIDLARRSGLTLEEVSDLQSRAASGDADARARLRSLKEARRAGAEDGEETLELPALDFSDAASAGDGEGPRSALPALDFVEDGDGPCSELPTLDFSAAARVEYGEEPCSELPTLDFSAAASVEASEEHLELFALDRVAELCAEAPSLRTKAAAVRAKAAPARMPLAMLMTSLLLFATLAIVGKACGNLVPDLYSRTAPESCSPEIAIEPLSLPSPNNALHDRLL